MNTDSLNVDLQPTYVRVDVKGKITQIRFDEDILTDQSSVQRSTTSGWLCITMPKAQIDAIRAQQIKSETHKEEFSRRSKLRLLEMQEEEAREARILELKARAKKDAARDRGELPPEEEKKDRVGAAGYKPASDPSFLIEKSTN